MHLNHVMISNLYSRSYPHSHWQKFDIENLIIVAETFFDDLFPLLGYVMLSLLYKNIVLTNLNAITVVIMFSLSKIPTDLKNCLESNVTIFMLV